MANGKRTAIVTYALKKITEPSTWAGLSILAALFGIPPGAVAVAAKVSAAIGAAGAIIINEQGPT
jgi:uncharacterized membrane protein AbrB (regulator of aidB expression)